MGLATAVDEVGTVEMGPALVVDEVGTVEMCPAMAVDEVATDEGETVMGMAMAVDEVGTVEMGRAMVVDEVGTLVMVAIPAMVVDEVGRDEGEIVMGMAMVVDEVAMAAIPARGVAVTAMGTATGVDEMAMAAVIGGATDMAMVVGEMGTGKVAEGMGMDVAEIVTEMTVTAMVIVTVETDTAMVVVDTAIATAMIAAGVAATACRIGTAAEMTEIALTAIEIETGDMVTRTGDMATATTETDPGVGERGTTVTGTMIVLATIETRAMRTEIGRAAPTVGPATGAAKMGPMVPEGTEKGSVGTRLKRWRQWNVLSLRLNLLLPLTPGIRSPLFSRSSTAI
jgi:hypothetical protein